MTSLFRNTLVYVWIFLVSATLFSWWAATSSGSHGSQISVAITASVLLMSFVKVRLVLMHFMEVRFAPPWLRLSCDAWLILLIGMVFGFYWLGL